MDQRPIRHILDHSYIVHDTTNVANGGSPMQRRGAVTHPPTFRPILYPQGDSLLEKLTGVKPEHLLHPPPVVPNFRVLEAILGPMAQFGTVLRHGEDGVGPEAVDTLESFMAPSEAPSESSRAGTDEPPAKRIKLESPDPRERMHQSEPAENIKSDPFGAPTVQLSGISGTFVISLGFLKHQSLASLVRSYYRTARWVEADFSNPNLLSSLGLASRCSDIDMVVAPNIALMTTTVARLHQRPLPDTVARPNLLSNSWSFDPAAYMPPDAGRIVRTVPFYRRTILLVSQGLPASSTSAVKLSRDDKKAMQDFRNDLRMLGLGKAQGSRGDVKLEYCAGGERELAKWVVAMMVQYGHGGWRPGGREGWAEMEE